MDSIERSVTAEERIAELERINAELRRANQRLARERLGIADSAAGARLAGPSAGPPPAVESASRALRRAGYYVKRVILYILPHGLTVLLVAARGRDSDDNRRS
jgi:hypothetical protein